MRSGLGVILVSVFFSAPVWGQDLPVRSEAKEEAPGAYLCTGYDPGRSEWGLVGPVLLGQNEESCAPGYAYLSVDFPSGTPRAGSKIGIRGRCCRLPDGVLGSNHVYTLEECPEGYVATGAKTERTKMHCPKDWGDCIREWEAVDHWLRCTDIDSRFQLGTMQSAYVLGFNHSLNLRGIRGERFTSRSRVPLGLRYGVTRDSRNRLGGGGYIGYPWGSVLVAKKSKTEFLFREIQYAGLEGDPPIGTPVAVVAECISVSDPFDPDAYCVTGDSTETAEVQSSIENTRLPPQRLSKVLIRHQARMLQLFWATAVGLETLAGSPEQRVDPIVILNPKRWSVATGAEAKDSILANIVGPLEEVEFYLRTLRDKNLPDRNAAEPTAESVVDARNNVISRIDGLEEVTSSERIRAALLQVSAELEKATAEFFRETELLPLRFDEILPLEQEEMMELRGYGIIGTDRTAEHTDQRSNRILSVIRSQAR